MISGLVFGPNAAAEGSPAIKLKDLDEGWVLIMMIEAPSMPFPGMVREEHALPGSASIFEANCLQFSNQLASDSWLQNLQPSGFRFQANWLNKKRKP